MKINLTTSPTPEDAKTISQGLVTFNQRMVKELKDQDTELNFSVFARDDSNNINGGLRATCFWNTLHIELLWVAEELRGQGVGQELLEKAEQYALENGFEQALLESTSWQAKPFYEKMGYTVMATLPEYPKGHETHFMTKRLIR